jgi:GAF domain-containing protein
VDVSTSGEAPEQLVREHAALRRVATLVAREPPPSEVFAAVTLETGELLGAQRSTLLRVATPERAEVIAGWSRAETAPPVPAGHSALIDGRGILGRMLRDPRPVRLEDFDEVGGVVAALMRQLCIRSAAAGPILIGDRLWGALTASWPAGAVMPAGAEDRVAAFAELVAAALELTVLDRRLERDPEGAREILARARALLDGGLEELRDLARGIHPAVLTDRGLKAALEALVQRAPLPVDLRADLPARLDPAIEAAAYFLVSEALTNVAKYAQAAAVTVDVEATDGRLAVVVADDGVGGADPQGGSGLRGLIDRVQAIGGELEIRSPAGEGTRLQARLPLQVLAPVNG